MYVLVGIELIGTFESTEEAAEYRGDHPELADYVITPIITPVWNPKNRPVRLNRFEDRLSEDRWKVNPFEKRPIDFSELRSYAVLDDLEYKSRDETNR